MKDWDVTSIGKQCTVIAGQSPKGKFYNQSGIGLPFYQGKKEFGSKYIGKPQKWTSQTTKEALNGDILMSIRAPVGPINYSTQKICIGRGLAAIRAGAKLDKEYLFYYLSSKQDEIKGHEGAVFSSINKKQIESITLPLPTLPEQQRIVSILDKVFEGIDKAIANTERNLVNSRELFLSVVDNEIFGNSVAKSWNSFVVEDLSLSKKGSIRTGPFGSQLLHSEFVEQGVPVLGIDNAVENKFKWGKRRFITKEKYEQLSRYTVKPKDVLITIMGTCGRCAVIPEDIPVAINTKHLCCITLDQQKCLPEFLQSYFLYHPVAQTYLHAKSKGAIMAGLNMKIIKGLPVKLPKISEQKQIIETIAKVSNLQGCLLNKYNKKLKAFFELKQSILKKAFTGELTAKYADKQMESAV